MPRCVPSWGPPRAWRRKLGKITEATRAGVLKQGWARKVTDGKELVGARYVLNEEPGVPKSNYEHDVTMRIVPVGDHPIVQGIAPFPLVDETYGKMQYQPGLKVLLRSDAPGGDGMVAWISPYAKSRVVVMQLGHDHQAHDNPQFREVFRRCVLWAGQRL